LNVVDVLQLVGVSIISKLHKICCQLRCPRIAASKRWWKIWISVRLTCVHYLQYLKVVI